MSDIQIDRGYEKMPKLASIVTSPQAEKYIDLPAAELNALAAKAHGWEDGHFQGEPGWFSDGKVLEQLASSYKPAGNIAFALEILKELTDEGYCIAINTKDIATGDDVIIIGGVPTKEGNPGLPQVVIDASETQLYIPELCRAITILYIVHKEVENE